MKRKETAFLVLLMVMIVAGIVWAICLGDSEYNRRSTAEYRQMISEGK